VIIDVLAASTGTGIGMAIGGIVAVLAISAVFYAIGRGEDRDRAAAAGEPDAVRATQPDGRQDEPPEPPTPADRRLPAAARRPRRR